MIATRPQRSTEQAIRKSPGVCGGEACIRSFRIPVWGLVSHRKMGVDDTRLLEFYPELNRDDLAAAWDYYAANIAEIDRAIELNEAE